MMIMTYMKNQRNKNTNLVLIRYKIDTLKIIINQVIEKIRESHLLKNSTLPWVNKI